VTRCVPAAIATNDSSVFVRCAFPRTSEGPHRQRDGSAGEGFFLLPSQKMEGRGFRSGLGAVEARRAAELGELPRICARGIHHLATPLHYGWDMGRPRIYEEPRVATAIRLPESLRNELLAVATARDVSVNFLVISAVSNYLKHLPASGSDDSARPRRSRRRITRKQ
jgi:hypothetical protein